MRMVVVMVVVVEGRRRRGRRVQMLVEADGQRIGSRAAGFAHRRAGQVFARSIQRRRHHRLDDRRRRLGSGRTATAVSAFVGAKRRVVDGIGRRRRRRRLAVVQFPRVFLQVEIAAESLSADATRKLSS